MRSEGPLVPSGYHPVGSAIVKGIRGFSSDLIVKRIIVVVRTQNDLKVVSFQVFTVSKM